MIASFLAALARLIAGASASWVEPLPEKRQRVYFANHSSHLDFVLVWSALPPRMRRLTRPVAAADYWDCGWFRRYLAASVFRAVLIDRANGASGAEQGREAISRMVSAIGTADSLILFPEGTRGTGEQIAPFKSGLYHLCCARPDLELVPVHLENLNRILPKGELVPVPMLSRVTFGPPMRLQEGESKDAFLDRARNAVEGLASQ
jgi:1-acyl-sn-glycerol-3-phosphate acyltransferase